MDRCNQKIYDEGEVVFLTHTIHTKDAEMWVQKVAKDSGQPVDWHSFCGRVVVKTTGDIAKVKAAILDNKSMHDCAIIDELEKLNVHHQSAYYSNETIKGIWTYNGF